LSSMTSFVVLVSRGQTRMVTEWRAPNVLADALSFKACRPVLLFTSLHSLRGSADVTKPMSFIHELSPAAWLNFNSVVAHFQPHFLLHFLPHFLLQCNPDLPQTPGSLPHAQAQSPAMMKRSYSHNNSFKSKDSHPTTKAKRRGRRGSFQLAKIWHRRRPHAPRSCPCTGIEKRKEKESRFARL